MDRDPDADPNEAAEFQRVLGQLPPVGQWSSATVEELKGNLNDKSIGAEWGEDSKWTHGLLNTILSLEEGWDWQRLKGCSTVDYFSLPDHAIALLNAAFHSHRRHEVNQRIGKGDIDRPLKLRPSVSGRIGYPIFRVDYSNDAQFEMFKSYWYRFLEDEYFLLGAVDEDNVSWHWVEDKDQLEGEDSQGVRRVLSSLAGHSLPAEVNHLKVCIMIDRPAIESLLRVYGPHGKAVYRSNPTRSFSMDLPYAPFFTAVVRAEESSVEEFPGHFRCALASVLRLWEIEDSHEPEEYYPRDGMVWADFTVAYEPPPNGA